MDDHPVGVGENALALVRGKVYVLGRQGDSLYACTSPLPDEITSLAMEQAGGALPKIGAWLISESRVFIQVFENTSIAAFELTELTDIGLGFTAGVCRAIDQDEVTKDRVAMELTIHLMTLARQIFPRWAADESLARLDEKAPNFMQLGRSTPLEA